MILGFKRLGKSAKSIMYHSPCFTVDIKFVWWDIRHYFVLQIWHYVLLPETSAVLSSVHKTYCQKLERKCMWYLVNFNMHVIKEITATPVESFCMHHYFSVFHILDPWTLTWTSLNISTDPFLLFKHSILLPLHCFIKVDWLFMIFRNLIYFSLLYLSAQIFFQSPLKAFLTKTWFN